MARQVDIIYVIGGIPKSFKAHTKHKSAVVWIPENDSDMLDIEFTSKTPFNEAHLTAAHAGDCLGAVVIADPALNKSETFDYTLTNNGIQVDAAADPQIIVDGGGGSRPRNPTSRPSKKTNAGKKKSGDKNAVNKTASKKR
jgi:hypothetical protein